MKYTKKPACLQNATKNFVMSAYFDSFMKSESDFSGGKLFGLFSKIFLNNSTLKRKQKLLHSN